MISLDGRVPVDTYRAPEPVLVQTYLPPSDHCHGADMPIVGRVWFEPIGDEL